MKGQQTSFGCYGKLPFLGDFVRRGLPQDYVAAWDSWLQQLLVSGRQSLGPRWSECYLSAPIWRFAISADLCGAQALVGVVMPSIDRVGRQFPLCLAAPLDTADNGETPSTTEAYLRLEPLIAKLESLVLSMLEPGATLAQLANGLASLPSPALCHASKHAPRSDGSQVPNLSSGSIWVAEVDEKERVLLSPSLPAGQTEAAAFFDLNNTYWHP